MRVAATAEKNACGAPIDPAPLAFEHGRELARQLIRHLGVEGATRTCRENHWDGVLSEVLSQAKK